VNSKKCKIVFIGAGSAVFTHRVVADILCEPTLSGSTIVLMDIDETRLKLIKRLINKMIRENKCKMKIKTTTNRQEALEGANFVINTIHVGGVDVIHPDFEIPAKYGLKQTIADTIGAGGIFRFMRVVPVMMSIIKDMERLCPEALFLNYTNPMCLNTSVIQTLSKIRSVGLCHSVQNVAFQMAKAIGIDYDDVIYSSAGVNHMAWFHQLEDWDGNDLYPRLRAAIKKDPDCIPPMRKVNADLFEYFDLFPTEGSNHHAEYLPYYLKSDKEIERLGIKVNAYIEHFGERTDTHEETMKNMLKDSKNFELNSSGEYAVQIIRAFHTNKPERIHASVLNTGSQIMPEFPSSISVEVPVYVDRNGFNAMAVPEGTLPPAPLALAQAHASVYQCAVRGYLEGNRDLITQAIELDPNVATQLTLPKIRAMVKEMFKANEGWLREFGSAMARKTSAKKTAGKGRK
jgi:alpha-galactosidase